MARPKTLLTQFGIHHRLESAHDITCKLKGILKLEPHLGWDLFSGLLSVEGSNGASAASATSRYHSTSRKSLFENPDDNECHNIGPPPPQQVRVRSFHP